MADEPAPERVAKVAATTLQDDDSRSGPWIEIFHGPDGVDRYVPEEHVHDTYAYVWIDFMNPANRAQQRIWWPKPAEDVDTVLQKMFEEHFEDYRKKNILLRQKKISL